MVRTTWNRQKEREGMRRHYGAQLRGVGRRKTSVINHRLDHALIMPHPSLMENGMIAATARPMVEATSPWGGI